MAPIFTKSEPTSPRVQTNAGHAPSCSIEAVEFKWVANQPRAGRGPAVVYSTGRAVLRLSPKARWTRRLQTSTVQLYPLDKSADALVLSKLSVCPGAHFSSTKSASAWPHSYRFGSPSNAVNSSTRPPSVASPALQLGPCSCGSAPVPTPVPERIDTTYPLGRVRPQERLNFSTHCGESNATRTHAAFGSAGGVHPPAAGARSRAGP